MEEELIVGQHPNNIYWAIRGDSYVSENHIKLFHDCGIRALRHGGTVWVINTLKFLRPFDTVNEKHIKLLQQYNNYKLNSRPTAEEEHVAPFPFSYNKPIQPMTPVQGNVTSNEKTKPKEVVKPPPKDESSDSEDEMISLFD